MLIKYKKLHNKLQILIKESMLFASLFANLLHIAYIENCVTVCRLVLVVLK